MLKLPDVFNRRVTGFLLQANPFELNFCVRKLSARFPNQTAFYIQLTAKLDTVYSVVEFCQNLFYPIISKLGYVVDALLVNYVVYGTVQMTCLFRQCPLGFTVGLSLPNWLAMRTTLPAWFDYLRSLGGTVTLKEWFLCYTHAIIQYVNHIELSKWRVWNKFLTTFRISATIRSKVNLVVSTYLTCSLSVIL